MSDEPLRLSRKVILPYRFAAGTYAARFFEALHQDRVLATRCPNGHVLMPPRQVCGLCNQTMDEWVEVGPRATLAAYTVVYMPFTDPMTGEGRPVPYGFGVVRFDGAHTGVYHLVDETDPQRLRIGLPLEPVFMPRNERQGTLADIRHFKPVHEEGA